MFWIPVKKTNVSWDYAFIILVCVVVLWKVEARSVEHMKNIARGLENKIIELQQKLTEKVMFYACMC